jgi:23S rRNA G2069 N7-methylase RlmK/C1962 C5-methylase RlmI
VLQPGGTLFAATNAARLEPEVFLGQIRAALAGVGRRVVQEHSVPQPPDFPVSREEPAYLKTVWMRVA